MEVDAFLADSVVTADGKLYVQGGGWNNINAAQMPHQHDRIGIGILIYVPYTATNEQHSLDISLEDADGNELLLGDPPPGVRSEDGKVRHFGVQFNVGRPPTIAPGDEQVVPFALNINGLQFERADRYAFVISVDGTAMKRLSFRLHQRQTQTLTG